MNYIKLYKAMVDLESRPMPDSLPLASLLDLRERLAAAQAEVDAQIDAWESLSPSPEERLESAASLLWPNLRPEGIADRDSAELRINDVRLSLFTQGWRHGFDLFVACPGMGPCRAELSLATTREELAQIILDLLLQILTSTYELEARAQFLRNQLQSLLNEAVKPT